jgi:hypothetical protein
VDVALEVVSKISGAAFWSVDAGVEVASVFLRFEKGDGRETLDVEVVATDSEGLLEGAEADPGAGKLNRFEVG